MKLLQTNSPGKNGHPLLPGLIYILMYRGNAPYLRCKISFLNLDTPPLCNGIRNPGHHGKQQQEPHSRQHTSINHADGWHEKTDHYQHYTHRQYHIKNLHHIRPPFLLINQGGRGYAPRPPVVQLNGGVSGSVPPPESVSDPPPEVESASKVAVRVTSSVMLKVRSAFVSPSLHWVKW